MELGMKIHEAEQEKILQERKKSDKKYGEAQNRINVL